MSLSSKPESRMLPTTAPAKRCAARGTVLRSRSRASASGLASSSRSASSSSARLARVSPPPPPLLGLGLGFLVGEPDIRPPRHRWSNAAACSAAERRVACSGCSIWMTLTNSSNSIVPDPSASMASKSCSTLASLSCSPSRGSSRAKLCASRTLTRPTSSEDTASCSTSHASRSTARERERKSALTTAAASWSVKPASCSLMIT
mmetsp:Transcript_51653/g.124224  ORF Transcript_51653/g.124224 Transcript_51653/m.124224 type:complete len:204 (+) Transcript_51653:677-1288(+)